MSSFFGFFLTLVVYLILKKFCKIKIPIVISSSIIIMLFLHFFKIDYDSYNSGAKYITHLLSVATIALGYSLFVNHKFLMNNKKTILFGALFASITSILSTYFIAKLLNLDLNLILSLIPKSTTTPIAVEISKSIGGIVEITACIVVMTGLIGGYLGHFILKKFKINNDIAIGLSIGATSHVFGTLRCAERNKDKQVSTSTVSLIVVGIFTAILASFLLNFLIN